MGGFTSPKKYFLAILLLSAVIIVGVFFLYGYFIEDEGRSSLGVLSEEEALIIRSEMKDCYDQGGREGCYKQVANSLLEKFQPREILISFEENENQPEIFARCHEVTHYIGRDSYERYGGVAEAYNVCTAACWGGCYHGVLEQYFDDKNISLIDPSNELLQEEILVICGQESDHARPRIFSECFHGIGHAMMFITAADLPKSLALCDVLPNVSHRETCYSGVFMENSSSSTNLDHPSTYIKADDPMYPCNILGDKYLKLCYQYQSSHFALITSHNWAEVIALCNQVPEAYRDGCFRIVGSNQIGFTQDYEVMIENCNLITDQDFRNVCIEGAVGGLGGRYVGDPSYMMDFCNLVHEGGQQACFRQIGAAVTSWNSDPAARTEICSELNDERHISWCNGA